jgi:tRNA threonylcarbamoyl adenosine modification protein (Sua5/YciO/YrdC/YwlC family)
MSTAKITDEIVAKTIADGGVIVLPCDTIYGVVCSATNREAVDRLYALKHREHKPGTIIAADIDQLIGLGLKRRYIMPLADYWPGAVSVIIPCGEELEYLHQGVGSLAVRVPAGDELQKLLKQTGPLLTSSANHPGEPPANNIEDARQYFATMVDLYVDGGDYSGHQPSTIVRVVDDELEVVRQGAVQIVQ